MKKFTKGFIERSASKLSDKINEYAEKASAEIVSVNIVTTNMEAPIIEAIVLFSKKKEFNEKELQETVNTYKKGNN